MSEQEVTQDAQQPTTKKMSDHRGVLFIARELLCQIAPEITIDDTDTIGHLRKSGVFETLHARLLLPEQYTIVGIFLQCFGRQWAILIESPDLPDVSTFLWDGIEYPRIEPVYCSAFNEELGRYEPHIVEIKVHAQHTVPIKGGIDWLIQASVGNLAKRRQVE